METRVAHFNFLLVFLLFKCPLKKKPQKNTTFQFWVRRADIFAPPSPTRSQLHCETVSSPLSQ